MCHTRMRKEALSGGQQQQQRVFVVDIMSLISDERLIIPNELLKKVDRCYLSTENRSASNRIKMPMSRVNPISEDPP